MTHFATSSVGRTAAVIDDALKNNMIRAYRKVLGFLHPDARKLLSTLLGRWDVFNVKTILRGAQNHVSLDDMKSSFFPAGYLSLDELEALKQQAETQEKALADVAKKADLLTGAVMDDPVIHARTKGVGILTRQDILDFGAVGPTARASGVAIDVRRDDPYAAYPLVNWKIITAEEGDVFAKAQVRLLEMYESISIIEQCLDGLKKEKEGNIAVKVKEIPEGIGNGRAEAPRDRHRQPRGDTGDGRGVGDEWHLRDRLPAT